MAGQSRKMKMRVIFHDAKRSGRDMKLICCIAAAKTFTEQKIVSYCKKKFLSH